MTELKGFAHLVFYVCDQDPSSTHSHDHNETDHGHDHSHSNDLNYTFSHFKGHFIPMTIENADGKVKSAREGPSIHSNWAIIGIPCKNPPTLHHCCYDHTAPPKFWDITLVQFGSDGDSSSYHSKKHEILGVMQSGGENVLLTSQLEGIVMNENGNGLFRLDPTGNVVQAMQNDQLNGSIVVKPKLEFATSKIKIEKEAKAHVDKYFGSALGSNVGEEGRDGNGDDEDDEEYIVCLGEMVIGPLVLDVEEVENEEEMEENAGR